VLDVKNLEALAADEEPALQGVSFSIREGEILGFAGISGNGQSELAEVVTGMRSATKGRVIIRGKEYTNHAPREIIKAGVAHIPEKRRAMGVVEPMTTAENVVLKDIRLAPFSKGSFVTQKKSCPDSGPWFPIFGSPRHGYFRAETFSD
jgi:simple sugar transport system ATP-binding protein